MVVYSRFLRVVRAPRSAWFGSLGHFHARINSLVKSYFDHGWLWVFQRSVGLIVRLHLHRHDLRRPLLLLILLKYFWSHWEVSRVLVGLGHGDTPVLESPSEVRWVVGWLDLACTWVYAAWAWPYEPFLQVRGGYLEMRHLVALLDEVYFLLVAGPLASYLLWSLVCVAVRGFGLGANVWLIEDLDGRGSLRPQSHFAPW